MAAAAAIEQGPWSTVYALSARLRPFVAVNVALLAAELAASPLLGLRFTGVAAAPVVAACLIAFGLVVEAVGGLGDAARAGPAAAGILGRASAFTGAYILAGCSLALLTYLCQRPGLAFQDAAFVRADAALGFDWLGWWHFITAHPAVRWLLHLAYNSPAAQIVITGVLTATLARRAHAIEFLWLSLATGVAVSIVGGLFPALGASIHFHHGPADWLNDVTQLRARGSLTFDVPHMNGIVEFPSYHTIMAILFVWANRGRGALTGVFLCLNLTVVVSTLTEGGHYLVDVIAGAAVAFVAIAVSRRLTLSAAASASGGVLLDPA